MQEEYGMGTRSSKKQLETLQMTEAKRSERKCFEVSLLGVGTVLSVSKWMRGQWSND